MGDAPELVGDSSKYSSSSSTAFSPLEKRFYLEERHAAAKEV